MTLGGLLALAGLSLAGWAYQSDDGRAFAWGIALIVGAPLVRLLIGVPPKGKVLVAASGPVTPAPTVAPTSQAEAALAAKIAEYNAAKQAQYEQHVKR